MFQWKHQELNGKQQKNAQTQQTNTIPSAPRLLQPALPRSGACFPIEQQKNTSKMEMAKNDSILFKETLRFGAFSFGRVPPSDPSPHRVEWTYASAKKL